MNEENNVKEPIYLTYGSDLIDLLAFLNNAANDLENYLSNQPWSAKRKDLFRKAYVDIMNGGVTGATNTSGQWQITHNGDIDLSSKSQKEREMYGEAAYYIQQQMSKIPTKQNEEKLAEEEKKELPLFDNEFFTSGLQDYIGNNMFGGRNWSTTDDWNILDKRGENGLRGTSVRSKKLAEMLLNYSNTLEEGKYNFEGSPFKNLTDFKSRINNAISALNNDDPNDDRDALNAIGLRANDFLYDGSGDIADTEGHTYSQLALAIQAQNEADTKAKEAQELALTEANRKANSGVLDFIGGIHGTDARTNPQAYAEYISKNLGVGLQGFNEMNKAVQGLIEKGYNNGKGGGLTNAEKRQLGNFLYYIRQNNPNVKSGGWKISNLEWAELSKHKNLGSTNRDKYVRLPWQTSDGRYTYADDLGNVYFLKPLNLAKFETPAFLRSAAYNNYKNNFLKSPNKLKDELLAVNMNTPISQMKGFSPEMKRELQALAWDLGAFIDPEAITGTAMALRAAHLREQNRPEGWSLEKVLDWGTASMGGLPVLGDLLSVGKPLYRLGQLIKNSAQFVGYLSTAFGAIGATLAIEPLKKLATSPTSLTPQDVQNLAYGLMGLAGGVKTVRAAKAGKAYEQAKKGSLTIEHSIEIQTKDGKTSTIKLNDEEAKAVANEYKSAKNNKEANDKVISMASVRKKAKDLNIDLTDAKLLNGAGRLRGSKVGRMVTSTKNPVKTKPVYNSESPVQFDRSWSWTRPFNPIRANIIDRAYVPQENNTAWYKKLNNFIFGNYTPKPIETSTRTNSVNNSETTTSSSKSSVNIPKGRLTKELVSELRETLKGKKFGTAEFLDANFDIKNLGNVQFTTAKDGTRELKLTLKDGTVLSLKSSYLDNTKLENLRFLKSNLRKIGELLPKNQKAKINFELIKLLKKIGALKQGGTIDKQKIQLYKEFIKK